MIGKTGGAIASDIVRELPAVLDEPRLNLLTRVSLAAEVWLS